MHSPAAWALWLGLLAAAGPAGHATAATIGRLFTTPAERAALDATRGQTGVAAPVQPEPATASVATASPGVTLNGVLRRSSGKATLWLNQQPQDDSRHQLRAGQGATTLKLRTAEGQVVTLKPGQHYDPDNGKVRDDDGP